MHNSQSEYFPSEFVGEMLQLMKGEFSCKAEIGEMPFSRCSWLEMGILKGSVGLLSSVNEKMSIHKQLWKARDLVTL